MLLRKIIQIKSHSFFILKAKKPSNAPLNYFSEWKKQQEIKKKIIDTNEAEIFQNQINQKNFSFSVLSGNFSLQFS